MKTRIALLALLVPLSAFAQRVVVLGTAQDGGMPHTGCEHKACVAARNDPKLARKVASLAIVSGTKAFLVDASPDLPAQIQEVHTFRPFPEGRADRSPFDGVLLTHAHIGHYLGLAHFGFESLSTKDLPVYASPRMAEYLRTNGPWSQLVKLGNVKLNEIELNEWFPLTEGISVKAIPVPHRDEYSDTVAFLIQGPKRTLLYVPDTDTWKTWTRPLPQLIEEEKVDYALLDATFYSVDELPDRDLSKIRHPLVTDSMELLGPLVKAGKVKVLFTHLNHSNPALAPDGKARKNIEANGFKVLEETDQIDL